MENKPDIYEILRRTKTGPYCTVKEWDVQRIPNGIKQTLKKYKLEKTCDKENPVNFDYSLADTFYQAGYELALELGYMCEDTERIVKVSQEELDNSLKFAPSEVFVGEGKDGTWLRARQPADPYPIRVCSSLGITISEDVYPILTEYIAREREIDILEGGSLITVRGNEALAGTPWETLLGYEHGRLHREIRRRAGRPGMGAIGCISAVTEYGQFGAYGTPGGFLPTDLALILSPSELKIDYRTLHKVVHTLNFNGLLKCDSPAMIGGMSGPPEGAVLSAIAWALLSRPILQNHVGGCQLYDVRYLSNVNREGLWALSVAVQAISRNTHLITQPLANSVSGPCTDKLLYEIAAGISTIASSGGSLTTGPRTAGGKLHDYLTPLECRFLGEIGHKSSALEPKKVNDIVKELLPRYEADIKNPTVGKSFHEAFDLKTMRPTEEWEGIYRRVKSEMIELGIPLDKF
jgi:methylamine--corrinoid protein Co-methyltransferase